MGFVVHADGVVKPLGRPSSRLRLTFPLKALLTAIILAVAVKGYAMWAIGADLYVLQVATMLEGSNFERVGLQVLMPDVLSLWAVDRYDDIYAFVQGGMAATATPEG